MALLSIFWHTRFTANARTIAAISAIGLGAYGVLMLSWLETRQHREVALGSREEAPDFLVTQARYLDYQSTPQSTQTSSGALFKDIDNKNTPADEGNIIQPLSFISAPLRLEIKSKTLSYYSKTGTSVFENPQAEFTDSTKQNWLITAASATATTQNDENKFIVLEKDVKVTALPEQHFTMETEMIKIDPVAQTLSTPTQVKAKLNTGRVTAGGFESTVEPNVLKLTNGVKAVYSPTQSKQSTPDSAAQGSSK